MILDNGKLVICSFETNHNNVKTRQISHTQHQSNTEQIHFRTYLTVGSVNSKSRYKYIASILLGIFISTGMLRRFWKKLSWEKKGIRNVGENASVIQIQVSVMLCVSEPFNHNFHPSQTVANISYQSKSIP